ncbi:hypothetical protein Q1695_009307 [Nippostrongylus brasiliensis]|nr:hypothetical protein Q1695_009307 [Nippostrongylus brasiliensis]
MSRARIHVVIIRKISNTQFHKKDRCDLKLHSFHVPCYSCHRTGTGLTTAFYLLPGRGFIGDKGMHERLETTEIFNNSAAVPFSSWLVDNIKQYGAGNYKNLEPEFVFGLGRATGGQVNTIAGAISSEAPNLQLLHEHFYGGMTLTCAQIVDNEPRSLGFVHNIDYLLPDSRVNQFSQHAVTYHDYQKYDPQVLSLPIIDKASNIKITISWDKWSCCSACCCSIALCGLYSNAKKCDEMDSYRTRKGLLSVFLNDLRKTLWLQERSVAVELDAILRLSPYRTRGIAIFSSFIIRTKRFKDSLYTHLQKMLEKAGYFPQFSQRVGMFIEEQSCAGMEEKLNCSALAACRGQVVEEPPPTVEELLPVDPCAETPMVTLSVIESSASFRFESNSSYRLRLDGLDMETMKSIKWRIGGKDIAGFDDQKPCDQQGIAVHANGFDLILIDPNETSIVGVEIEAFTGRHRFRIRFHVDSAEETTAEGHRVALTTIAIAVGATVLLLAAITLIHNFTYRTRNLAEKRAREGDSSKKGSSKAKQQRQENG